MPGNDAIAMASIDGIPLPLLLDTAPQA